MSVIVAMTGASGSIYGIRLLEAFRELDVETHLVMSRSAALTLRLETDYTPEQVQELASTGHSVGDIGASISSGSFKTDGMVVAPCSIKTLSGIVNSYEDNLIVRAAGVVLKEQRRLLLMVRETPLHLGHLRLMATAAEIGATIFPPVPAFYSNPVTIDDLVNQSVARVLDQFGYELPIKRWAGTREHLEQRGDQPS
ncbi:MAG: UbiX family flavin prenyltransferase [Nitriliruptoraceae bacterium]|nr:UbiX family flavin prenyltransferase [Nitriliruptoraceae bacterium]